MSIEGQGHFFTIYFPGFVCFVLYLDKISGERLQYHWSSGWICFSAFKGFTVITQSGIEKSLERLTRVYYMFKF